MLSVNACEESALCVTESAMNNGGISTSLNRAGRALDRIERALERRERSAGTDEALRAKVREAVAELDALISEASS